MPTTLEILYSVGAILMVSGLMLIARVVYARFAGYDVNHQLTEADNPAVGTAMFGYLGGLVIVFVALLATEGAEANDPIAIAWDLAELLLYGLVSIVLLKISGLINDRFVLHRFENQRELVDDRNVGAAAVLCGSYLGSALVLAGAFHGRIDPEYFAETPTHFTAITHEIGIGLAFFGLGQLVLVLYGHIYQMLQPVNVHQAIADDYEKDGVHHGGNDAAGVAFGGNLVALGLVLFGGSHGVFDDWGDKLFDFGLYAAIGCVLLPLWRIFADRVLLSGADLAKEIYEDRNLNAAYLETVTLLGLAGALIFII